MVSRMRTLELRKSGQWQDALASATADLERGDGEYVNLMWRGLIYRQLGQIVLAIADFTTAMRWEAADPYYYRGNAYLAMGRYEEAAADHQRYLEISTVKNSAEIARVKEMNRVNGGQKKPDPANYAPLDWAFCLDSDCELSAADCEMALNAGHESPLIYFCQGVAYEMKRDFFRAVACYQNIEDKDLNGAAQVAIERAQEAALYAAPGDKAVMRPGIEYLRVITDHMAQEHIYEYFDLNGYRKEIVAYKGAANVRVSWGWRLVAERSTRERTYRFYQCGSQMASQRQSFWERLKSKLSLS